MRYLSFFLRALSGMAVFICFGFNIEAVALPVYLTDEISIDLPESFVEKENTETFKAWSDTNGQNEFLIYVSPEGNYDMEKCMASLDRTAFDLSHYASYDEETEKNFDWYHEYLDRYYYHLSSKERLVCRTTYAGGRPLCLAYTYDAGDAHAIESFKEVAATMEYKGSWWQRFCDLFAKSWVMILIFPFFCTCVAGVLELWIPKKVLVTILFAVFFILGFPLWKDWTMALPIYGIWTFIFGLFSWLNFRDYVEATDQINKAIP